MTLADALYCCLALALFCFGNFLIGAFLDKPGMLKVVLVLGGIFGTFLFGFVLPIVLHELLK